MGQRKQTKGKCVFCGREMTRSGLARHLQTCPERMKANEQANQLPGRQGTLIHLQVQDADWGEFWLHLEMKGSVTLEKLDAYLRSIWLECCGHLSMFSTGGWGEDEEVPMQSRAASVFTPGVELTHIYDFGTTSYTTVKVVSVRRGKPLTRYPIYLMARNGAIVLPCDVCGQPATFLCIECCQMGEDRGYLCNVHARQHTHNYAGYEDEDDSELADDDSELTADDSEFEDDEIYGEFLMSIFNSPRTGMCGYDGPAEPPY